MKDDQKITILKGPDRVRKRPAVIFGSDGVAGVQNAVNGLLEIFVAEAETGNCTQIIVKQDGAQLEISCDDRGLYLGHDRQDDLVWQERLCMLYPAPAYPEEYKLGLTDDSDAFLFCGKYEEREFSFGSLYLAAVQCASAHMDVTVVRGGYKSSLHFKKGYPLGGLQKEPSAEKTGTTLRFMPDREVFTETVVPEDFLKTRLQQLAMLCPGLHCTYENSTGSHQYCYKGGIREYLQERSSLPVFYTSLEATGRERYNRSPYTARVEIAVGLCPEPEHLCIHNLRVLTHGGTHYETLQEQLELAFRQIAKPEELTVVLVTRCARAATAWENGTRLSIANTLIRDMTYDAAGIPLQDFAYEHKEQMKKGHP